MDVLETSSLFGGIPPTELAQLKKAAEEKSFAPGEVIFREGDVGDGLYLVAEGQVEISACIHDGERRVLSRLGPGHFFGEMAVVDNEPRSATALAEQPTKVTFIGREQMLAFLEGSPRLAVNLMRQFSLRLREFNRQFLEEVLAAERLTLLGRFVRSVVHDFKNPLNVIGIAADFAVLDTATTDQRQSARNRIRKQIEHLSNMINELLEFTRGSKNMMVLAATDYPTFLQQLLKDLEQTLADNRVTLHWANQPPTVSVLLDPGRFFRVFSNLFQNALDFMPDGGTITLRFRCEDREVWTEIQDTGPGIAPEIAPQLFEAFATYGKAQGTGLGLSIAKRIVEDHGGRIEARNAPDGGAIFSFALPLLQI